MDVTSVRVALERHASLDPLDPRAVSLARAIVAAVPTLLATIEQLAGETERARLERAAEKEAARMASGWFW